MPAKNTTGVSPIIYVARDIERALGMPPENGYFIIANRSGYAEEIRTKYPENVFLIDWEKGVVGNVGVHNEPFDTYELLARPETEKIINDILEKSKMSKSAPVSLLVFKNTSRIEAFCKEKKWRLLNPPAALAERIENKITQVGWLGDLARYLPAHEIVKMSDMEKLKIKKPFVIQWAHGHTGGGTIFVSAGKDEKILDNLREKFPDREARITEYVKGPMFTVNICVGGDKADTKKSVLVGNISYQITGILPFTDNPFATVGNDWSLPHTLLSEKNIADMSAIARSVGERMLASGWSGLFGIDCIYDEERDALRLIEINARQPASAAYESQLQEKFREPAAQTGDSGARTPTMTMFEAHSAALTGQAVAPASGKIVEINDGAQIVDRVKTHAGKMETVKIKELAGRAENLRVRKYAVIEYENVKPGADLLRIQSGRGIMETHNKFNSRGKEILEAVSGMV